MGSCTVTEMDGDQISIIVVAHLPKDVIREGTTILDKEINYEKGYTEYRILQPFPKRK